MISTILSIGVICFIFCVILGCIVGYFAVQFLIFAVEMFLGLIQCFFDSSDDDD